MASNSKNINIQTNFVPKLSNRFHKKHSGPKKFKKPILFNTNSESLSNSKIKNSQNINESRYAMEQTSLKKSFNNENDIVSTKITSTKQMNKSNYSLENSKILLGTQPFQYEKSIINFPEYSDRRDNTTGKHLPASIQRFSIENSPILTEYDQNRMAGVFINYSPEIIDNNQGSKQHKNHFESTLKEFSMSYIKTQLSPQTEESLKIVAKIEKQNLDHSFQEASSFFREHSQTFQPLQFDGVDSINESQNLSLMDINKMLPGDLLGNSLNLFNGGRQEISAIELFNSSNIEHTRFTLGSISTDQISQRKHYNPQKNDNYIGDGYGDENKENQILQFLNNNSIDLKESSNKKTISSRRSPKKFKAIPERKFEVPLQITSIINTNHDYNDEIMKRMKIKSPAFSQNETRTSTRAGNNIDSTYFSKNIPSSRLYGSLHEQNSMRDHRPSHEQTLLSDNFASAQNFGSTQGNLQSTQGLQSNSNMDLNFQSTQSHANADPNFENKQSTETNPNVDPEKINNPAETITSPSVNIEAEIKAKSSFDLTLDTKHPKNPNFSVNVNSRRNSIAKKPLSLCLTNEVNQSIYETSLEKSRSLMTNDSISSQPKLGIGFNANVNDHQIINESQNGHSSISQCQNLGRYRYSSNSGKFPGKTPSIRIMNYNHSPKLFFDSNSLYKKEDCEYACPFSRPSSISNSRSNSVSKTLEKKLKPQNKSKNLAKYEIHKQLNAGHLSQFQDEYQDSEFKSSKIINSNDLLCSKIISPKESGLSSSQRRNLGFPQTFTVKNSKIDVDDKNSSEFKTLSYDQRTHETYENDDYLSSAAENPLLEYSMSISKHETYQTGACARKGLTNTSNSQDFKYSYKGSPSKSNRRNNNHFKGNKSLSRDSNIKIQDIHCYRGGYRKAPEAYETDIESYRFQDLKINNKFQERPNLEDDDYRANMSFNDHVSFFDQEKDYDEYYTSLQSSSNIESPGMKNSKRSSKCEFLDFPSHSKIKGMMLNLNYSTSKKLKSSPHVSSRYYDKDEHHSNYHEEYNRNNFGNSVNNKDNYYNQKYDKLSKNMNRNMDSLDLTFDSNSHSLMDNMEISRFSKISDLSGFGITKNPSNEKNKHKSYNTCNYN